LDANKRRLDVLKLEGLGFSQAEIVTQVSEKAKCSKRTVYTDLETRASWQPVLQSTLKPQEVLLKVVNRYEQIYRQASLRVLSASNPMVQLGALNTMLKANYLMCETLALSELLCRLHVLEQKAARGVFVA
jgi:hypothetical protein